jgi:tetratricopeptide (TPR) repeat protein
MAKGSIQETRSATDVVRLRDDIRTLEIGCGALRGRGSSVRDLLKLRDSLQVELDRLVSEQGLDLRPERTRVETIDNILVRKTAQLSRELGSSGGFAAARQEVKPGQERWWWYLDVYRADKNRKALIRGLSIVAAVLIVILGANAYLEKRFGLSPEEKEARGLVMQAEQQTRDGGYDQAVVLYEQASAISPSLDAYVALGALYERAGQVDRSAQALQAAQAIAPDQASYSIMLSKAYQETAEPDKAMAAINLAIEQKPTSAEAFMVRGGLYEDAQDVQQAMDDYQKAADLATANGEDELYVLSRMRLGMLMQRGPSMGGGMGGVGGF